MANTINRNYPGDLQPGNGLTFRTALNADRTALYGHIDAMQAALEVLSHAVLSDGTSIENTAELTIDSPSAGTVYCPAGYRAIIGGTPVITGATISQAYTAATTNYVFLCVGSDGALSLRCSESSTPSAGEILVASISAAPAINNTPTGKPYARISLGTGANGTFAGGLNAEFLTFTSSGVVGTESVLTHHLGRTPVGYLCIKKDKASHLYDGTTAFSSTQISFRASVATTAFTVMVF